MTNYLVIIKPLCIPKTRWKTYRLLENQKNNQLQTHSKWKWRHTNKNADNLEIADGITIISLSVNQSKWYWI